MARGFSAYIPDEKERIEPHWFEANPYEGQLDTDRPNRCMVCLEPAGGPLHLQRPRGWEADMRLIAAAPALLAALEALTHEAERWTQYGKINATSLTEQARAALAQARGA